jgi:acyl-coenzyme A thioesterase PaaI-like protein
VPLIHHELCFGCGRTNLFGLLLEVEPTGREAGAVRGRCFVKQDHQGGRRGSAHDGIVATALAEAMALACGPGATAETLEVNYAAPAPVGTFLDIEAQAGAGEGEAMSASAHASTGGVQVAHATGTFRF